MYFYRKLPGTIHEPLEIHKQQSVNQTVMKNMFPFNFYLVGKPSEHVENVQLTMWLNL